VTPAEGLPRWKGFFEGFGDAGFAAVREVSVLGLAGLGLMPEESFLKREGFAEETLREGAFFLSEKDKTFFNGEHGFATIPRDAASIADVNFAESVPGLNSEKFSASNGESGHEPRT